MKKPKTLPWRLAVLLPLFVLFLAPQNARACDRSSLTAVSFTDNGTSFDYVVRLCIGAGIEGANRGADANTRDFALGFNGLNTPLTTLSNFTPSLTSMATGVTNVGINAGPNLGDEIVLLYSSTSSDPFTCVSNTAQCGTVNTECFNISFTTDVILESVQVYGIEGSGNPFAGCFGNADMFLNFAALPVELTTFEVVNSEKQAVDLIWETSSEINSEGFEIERSKDGVQWTFLDYMPSQGDGTSAQFYEYQDRTPSYGLNYYRLKQIDIDGTIAYSPIINVKIDKSTTLSVIPNPTYGGQVKLALPEGQDSGQLTLHALDGSMVYQEKWIGGKNQVLLTLPDLKPGLYLVNYSTSNGQFTEKIVIK